MTKRPLILIFTALAGMTAVANDAAIPNAQELLQNLQVLKEKNRQSGDSRLEKIFKDVSAGANSSSAAMSLYEQAIQQSNFEGRSQAQSQFLEWRRKQGDKLKDDGLQTATRLHLAYLAISLKAVAGLKHKDLVPDLINYTNELSRVYEDVKLRAALEKQTLLSRPIAQGIFSNVYGIQQELGALKGWEPIAGNIDGIYQQTILPVMRENKDKSLLRYWDARLHREQQAAEASRLNLRINTFNQVTRPSLIWSRSQDLILLGYTNEAVQEMFKLIRDYPAHPNNARWIAFLEGVLAPPPPPTPEVTAPETSTASQPAPATR